MNNEVRLTQNGFCWGPVEISRIATEPEDISGGITLGLKTIDVDLQIYITRAGMIRIYLTDGEMVTVMASAPGPG
jgi:hypothetical protein